MRILVIGQAVHKTGYARVLHSLLPYLSINAEIFHFGINYTGLPPTSISWTIISNTDKSDHFGVKLLPSLLENIRPDIVWILFDLFIYSIYKRHFDESKIKSKIILYCPIDGVNIQRNWLKSLIGLDRLVLFTDFARQEVQKVIQRNPPIAQNFPTIDVIPHGIDTNCFYPLSLSASSQGFIESKRIARGKLFPKMNNIMNAFIVLNANRNHSRKRLDITIEAFAEFTKNKPENVYLYLHTGFLDKGMNLLRLIKHFNIENRLLVTSYNNSHPQIDDNHLNLIYNACDIGVNTGTGEGWGLTAFEHAATGNPQILPKHSACYDLWQGIATFANPVEWVKYPFEISDHQVINTLDVTRAMDLYYRDDKYRQTQALKAYHFVQCSDFEWSTIANTWEDLFRRVLRIS